MEERLAVGRAVGLVVELREKKLSINDKTVTDTSDSILSASVRNFSEKRPLPRRQDTKRYTHLGPFNLKPIY